MEPEGGRCRINDHSGEVGLDSGGIPDLDDDAEQR
jgi:hypothetical protein